MDTFDSEGINMLDGIDDFTDLLKFDVGCRDVTNVRLPFLDDGTLLPGVEHPPWCTTAADLSEPASDNSSDSGISSVSIKHEPCSPDGSPAFLPSPVYFDSSPSISETHDDIFLTDVFTEPPRCSSDLVAVQCDLSPPLSPLISGGAIVSPVTQQPPTNAVPFAAVPPATTQDLDQMFTGVSKGSDARASGCSSDERLNHVLQSKVKIQPKFAGAVCQPQPAACLLADMKGHGTLRTDAGSPIIVSAEEFARLAARGVLKMQQPAAASSMAATAALNSSVISPLMPSRPVASSIITVAAGAKRPIPVVSHSGSSSIAAGDDGDDTDKALKKQQRMIKNRESASLSRKRRKEYMTGLEQMLQACSTENESLKQENSMLRRRVDELQAENDRLMSGAPLNKKAATTCLMTVALLFAFKLTSYSPVQSPAAILTPLHSADSNRVEFGQAARLSVGTPARIGRSLLSVDDDRTWTDNDSLRQDSAGVNSSSIVAERERAELMVVPNPVSQLCPTNNLPYNGSDSQRLVNDLSGWALRSKIAAKKTKMQPRAGVSTTIGVVGNNRRRGMAAVSSSSEPALKASRPTPLPSGYAMQVYGSRHSVDGKFLDAIRRRNDTFYVISFRMDHWLLPATAHNKTARPKMAILVPALPLNESSRTSETVTMLQIECEVMDTRFLRIDPSIIPLHAAWFPEHTSTSGKTPFSTSTSVNASATRPTNRAAPP